MKATPALLPALSMATSSLRLYGWAGSSTTNRVRIALAVKRIPYEFINVDLIAGEQFNDDFLRLNKLQQIPILQIDDKALLRQSVAIMEYIEESTRGEEGGSPLLPESPVERAAVREVVEIVNSYVQPMQNKLTVEKVSETDEVLADLLPKFVEAHRTHKTSDLRLPQDEIWPHFWINRGFRAIEGLIGSDGRFCFGDAITMADCALVPQVVGAKFYLVDVANKYPKIERVYQEMKSVPEIRAALGDYLV